MREVLLVGGGHAHVQVLRTFASAPLPDSRLTLVVDTPIAVYSGMVPGFVAGQYRADELEIDVGTLARHAGARIVIGRVVRIDTDDRQVVVDDHDPVAYDLASFNIGSTVMGLDLPGVREHAVPTRPISLFVHRVEEVVQRARDPGPPFHVVVVGGGAGGVELAFTLQRRVGAETGIPVRVVLVESGPRILNGYPQSLIRRVERHAAVRAIEVRCGAKVAAAEAGRVTLADGGTIACQALIWVTGAVSHPVFEGLSTDARGFVRTRSTLQFEHHDDLFAVGDCGTLIDHPQTPKAGVYAVRQGPVITHNLRAALTGAALRTYTPQRDFLTLLNLGDGTALGTKWGWSFGGRWVMKLKDFIDRRFVEGFSGPSSSTRP